MNARCLACKLLYTMAEYDALVIGCPHCQPMWAQIIEASKIKETEHAVDPAKFQISP